MSSNGLSKIGTTLTIIFVVSLTALLLELFYVLWRRRVFHRRQTTTDHLSDNSSSESTTFSPIASSKELLYFLCIRPQPTIEGNSQNDDRSIVNNGGVNVNSSNQELDMEVIDLMKIHGMFGPPRFLFTIKEEEKDDMDSPAGKSVTGCNSEEEVKKNNNGVSLEDCLNNEAKEEEKEEKEEESMVVLEIVDDVTTPFSTPCASPLYFTPSNSPIHEEVVAAVVNERSTVERLQV